MATTPKDRAHRLGRPSLFWPLLIAAIGAILVIAILLAWPGREEVATGEGDPTYEAENAEGETVSQVDTTSNVEGQGSEPDGVGGAADPGVFADQQTPLATGGSTNATSATQGDEMMEHALPTNPPGGGRVDPDPDMTVAGELAEEEVPEFIRESDIRTALPDGSGAAGASAAGAEDHESTAAGAAQEQTDDAGDAAGRNDSQ